VISITEVKAVKVSKETYAKLCEIAGELQIKLKRPVSIEEAMKHLIRLREKGVKITDLAGSWNITDEEIKEIKASISEAWKKWKPPEL
jgi:lipoate-protein ligase A